MVELEAPIGRADMSTDVLRKMILVSLPAYTGGRVVTSRNKPEAADRTHLRRGPLGRRPRDRGRDPAVPKADDRHRIKIGVKRSDVTVRARDLYFAADLTTSRKPRAKRGGRRAGRAAAESRFLVADEPALAVLRGRLCRGPRVARRGHGGRRQARRADSRVRPRVHACGHAAEAAPRRATRGRRRQFHVPADVGPEAAAGRLRGARRRRDCPTARAQRA